MTHKLLKFGFRFVLPLLAFALMAVPPFLLGNGTFKDSSATQLLLHMSLPMALGVLLMLYARPFYGRELLPGFRSYYTREGAPLGFAISAFGGAFSAIPLLALINDNNSSNALWYILGYFVSLYVLALIASKLGTRTINTLFRPDYDAAELAYHRNRVEQLLEHDMLKDEPALRANISAALALELNKPQVLELIDLIKAHGSRLDAKGYLEDTLAHADELRAEAQQNIDDSRTKLNNTLSRLKLLG